MARTSYGPRRATTWPVTQSRQPMPRVVRLGRAANDNHRRPRTLMRLCLAGLSGLLLAFILINWRMI